MEFDRHSYHEMLRELFERHPSVMSAGFATGAYKPGLDAMRNFDASLGYPSEKFRSIHVAGTNGKGSVSSMLAASLASGGLRVGLYTSPHLADFRERAKIISDGGWSMIPEQEVWDFVQGRDLGELSFFEITTGLAFYWFAKEKVDIAVIECGLGGRLDSTNILNPELSIVTGIDLDHCALLGNTRAGIAGEKAGIFKPGVPALVASWDDETGPVFRQRAAELHCPLFFADEFRNCDTGPEDFDLNGPYQELNLRTVLAALEILGEEAGLNAIASAARITGLRGRWEKLFSEPETICDIGHNPAALALNFRRLEQSGRPLFIVFGIMADKDFDSILPLMPSKARYFCVSPDSPRALSALTLAGNMEGLDRTVCSSVAEGVRAAIQEASTTTDALVYIGGSSFVVAECLQQLR